MNDDASWVEWFEAAWAQREDDVYASLFGSLGPGIYPLDDHLFNDTFDRPAVDPRWLTIGAFESPPTPSRKNWVYVSSGLSNAWEDKQPDPESWSGLGTELVMQCSQQSPWALTLIRRLIAYQLLLSVGHFKGREPLHFWDRMPVGGPIDARASELRALLFAPSTEFPGVQHLRSGKFEFLQVIGLAESELLYGRQHGYEELHAELVKRGAAPVVDFERDAVL